MFAAVKRDFMGNRKKRPAVSDNIGFLIIKKEA